jgi:3'-phosphoadenosine 5'-phosphosulfate sulfotransferase (PAPS reductase)/FAD synthetase
MVHQTKDRQHSEVFKGIPGSVSAIGFAADEKHRATRSNSSSEKLKTYPLIEWGITEEKALQYCYDKGFLWGGLYTHFDRVSCFCCPLQKLGDLRRLRKHYPELWLRMLDMSSQLGQNRGFRDYTTVQDLENRFAQEDKQLKLWTA